MMMRSWSRAHIALGAVLILSSAPAQADPILDTVAGGGPNNVPALSANVDAPWDVALDTKGNYFIAAATAQRVFKVDTAGLLTVVAGTGFRGFSGDGGPATDASLSSPIGVGLDTAGNLFIADSRNDRIRRVRAANEPPVALCQDVVIPAEDMTCTVGASIDNGSFDPDGDPITVVQSPPGPYGPGNHLVTLTVQASNSAEDTCQASVTVLDTTPPEIHMSLDSTLLWPPNHRLMDIEAAVTATDACGHVTVKLASITSNEPDGGPGTGVTTGDIQEALFGRADYDFALQAERSGDGNGRVYTVVYTATDGAGNQTSASSMVVVPHDQAGVVDPGD